jgi:hypothetical protein
MFSSWKGFTLYKDELTKIRETLLDLISKAPVSKSDIDNYVNTLYELWKTQAEKWDKKKEKKGEAISLRNSAQKFLPEFTWAEYPGEHHLPPIDGLSWNFFGPGTDLRERLKDTDSGVYEPKSFSEPTCAVDSAAYIHDVRYLLADGDLEKQHDADLEMIENLKHIKTKSPYEAFAKWLGIGIMNAKVKLGMGIDDEVMNKMGYGLESHEDFDKSNINFAELAKKDGSL